MKNRHVVLRLWPTVVMLGLMVTLVQASSHREAPFITEVPKVDGTDLYMFRSYEPSREGFVTIIANYVPIQVPYGGPNYFSLDPDALYEIHIDNNGDANEDLTFRFRFQNTLQDIALDIGQGENVQRVSIPLINAGTLGPQVTDNANANVIETYTLTLVRGDRRTGTATPIANAANGETTFTKPTDNIGNKSIPDYETYARNHIYDLDIPGCDSGGRVFVGQRREAFFINLGEVFDLVNVPNPIGETFAASRPNILNDANITSLVLEVPISCLIAGDDPVIGTWTTASLRQGRLLNPAPSTDPAIRNAAVEGGAWTQVSRLGMPLVNEVVIGLKDKDRFNASEPRNDADPTIGFGLYVTNPTLPALIELLFPTAQAPRLFPRADLVATFLTGLQGLNQPNQDTVQPAEMLRLNTETPPIPAGSQNRLGVISGDNAGFPNGRRLGDDVVDISLRVVMGRLITLGLFGTDPDTQAPAGNLDFTDGAVAGSGLFNATFPYLASPLPGSPAEVSQP